MNLGEKGQFAPLIGRLYAGASGPNQRVVGLSSVCIVGVRYRFGRSPNTATIE